MLKIAAIIVSRGGVVHTGNAVQEVNGDDNPYVVTDNGYRVEAGAIVVATHTHINDTLTLHTKKWHTAVTASPAAYRRIYTSRSCCGI